jgi:hypothetical protein
MALRYNAGVFVAPSSKVKAVAVPSLVLLLPAGCNSPRVAALPLLAPRIVALFLLGLLILACEYTRG